MGAARLGDKRRTLLVKSLTSAETCTVYKNPDSESKSITAPNKGSIDIRPN